MHQYELGLQIHIGLQIRGGRFNPANPVQS
jgi:hypothetical protein